MSNVKILAIETSTAACSAALSIDGVVSEQFQVAPRQHTDLILGMVQALLVEADIKLNQLDAIAFARGPGAFTGLRIAAGVTQGLAFGADLPVVPVSTLAALAQGVHREHGAERVLVANDAAMSEVYWGCYQSDSSGQMVLLGDEQVIAPTAITAPQGDAWIAAGRGWQAYKEQFSAILEKSVTRCYDDFYPRAQDVASLAIGPVLRNEGLTAEQALPLYLRDKVVGN